MAAQEAPNAISAAQFNRHERHRLRLIEAGELVSNAPLRERCEWLMNNDPEFSLVTACYRLADQGYTKFTRRVSRGRAGGERLSGDSTHLLRVLGMRDLAPTSKGGRRYQAPNRTTHIRYELAVAIARALDMDPIDAGV